MFCHGVIHALLLCTQNRLKGIKLWVFKKQNCHFRELLCMLDITRPWSFKSDSNFSSKGLRVEKRNYMRLAVEKSKQHKNDTRCGKLSNIIKTSAESVLLPAFPSVTENGYNHHNLHYLCYYKQYPNCTSSCFRDLQSISSSSFSHDTRLRFQ